MTQLTQGRFELEDGDGQPISFTGVRLAFVTSRRDEDTTLWGEANSLFEDEDDQGRDEWLRERGYRPRWMELAIYRTEGGRYVIEIVGQTTNTGEVIRSRAKVAETAEELVEGLHNTDDSGKRYITYTARDALMDAMRDDESLAVAWKSRAREVA